MVRRVSQQSWVERLVVYTLTSTMGKYRNSLEVLSTYLARTWRMGKYNNFLEAQQYGVYSKHIKFLVLHTYK